MIMAEDEEPKKPVERNGKGSAPRSGALTRQELYRRGYDRIWRRDERRENDRTSKHSTATVQSDLPGSLPERRPQSVTGKVQKKGRSRRPVP